MEQSATAKETVSSRIGLTFGIYLAHALRSAPCGVCGTRATLTERSPVRYRGELAPSKATGGGVRFVGARDRVVRPLPDVAAHVPDDTAVRKSLRPLVREVRIAREVIGRAIIWGCGFGDGIVGIAASHIAGADDATRPVRCDIFRIPGDRLPFIIRHEVSADVGTVVSGASLGNVRDLPASREGCDAPAVRTRAVFSGIAVSVVNRIVVIDVRPLTVRADSGIFHHVKIVGAKTWGSPGQAPKRHRRKRGSFRD